VNEDDLAQLKAWGESGQQAIEGRKPKGDLTELHEAVRRAKESTEKLIQVSWELQDLLSKIGDLQSR
jgi:hypothetical protein